jgi:hypothetical protein
MEEIDLCWRINNTGYKIMAIPQSIVYHVGGGTLDKLSPRKTFLNFRNSLISLTKNNANGVLLFKIITRLLLDGVAGVKFLCEGNARHTWAIIRAHFSFYFNLKRTLQQREEIKSSKNYNPCEKQIYRGSIVFAYYLKQRKLFSELRKDLFNA